MFVVHGQSGTISAIVGTSSVHKAIMHLDRMTQAGLSVSITDDQGRTCNPRHLRAGLSDRRA